MEDVASQFQKRRKRYIRISIGMGAFLLACFGAMVAILTMELGDDVALFAFVPFFLTIIAWVFVTYAIYRCPSCNHVPIGNAGGQNRVHFNPSECAKCGAILS